MLTVFSGKNYKAFNDFKLELKPLTVLLGANSCGKSALINSILMLSQTLDSTSLSESALRLNGQRVGMGESLNIIRNKDSSKILSFSFDFNEREEVKNSIDALKRGTIESFLMFIRFFIQATKKDEEFINATQEILKNISGLIFSNENLESEQLQLISKSICQILTMYRADKDNIKFVRPIPPRLNEFIYDCPTKRISDCFQKLMSISATKLSATRVCYDFKYEKDLDVIKVSRLTLFNKNNEMIIDLSLAKKNALIIDSQVIEPSVFRGSKEDVLKLLNPFSLNFFNVQENRGFYVFFDDTYNPVAGFLSQMVRCSVKTLSSIFNGNCVNHVSPLRAFPQRYYLLDKSIHHSQLNSLDGAELAEILKKNPKIKDDINFHLAEFNLAVDIEKVNDIIHKIIINQDAVNLELTDVGFGISQVLPVLVQAYLSPKNSITIIEQPEIHLHPKMQAWLTDAIIKIALAEEKVFLIETHSEALVRRIRLRIVDDNSPLSEEQVAIYHLERNKEKSSTTLNKISINSDGDISWPSDFMDVEIEDTIRIQELKVQKILNSRKETH